MKRRARIRLLSVALDTVLFVLEILRGLYVSAALSRHIGRVIKRL